MNKINNMVESILKESDTIKLIPDVYEDEYDALDPDELRSSFIEEDDFEYEFYVKEMSVNQMLEVKTPRGDMTVIEAFKDYADQEQKQLVAYKMKHWDSNKIVVFTGNMLLDGFHQLVAGIMIKKPIKYIDLRDYKE